MPLEAYRRGKWFWVRGRVEYNGAPITEYYRQSTGASDAAGAQDWVAAETERQRRRHVVGDEAERLTFATAVLEYKAKPVDAGYLHRILTLRPDLGDMPIDRITGKLIKNIGLEIYPDSATDSIWRQVVTPIRAVINNMHELGKGPPLRVKAFTENERILRDTKRGKQSRGKRGASDKAWIEAFCAHADVHNAAMVRLMFETGCRVDQAVSLQPRHLDLRGRKIWLKAQKGHPAQWVEISHAMMIELANLPPKQPKNRKTGEVHQARVFGYASRAGYRKRWKSICNAAGITYLRAHEAGRHGFGTELVVRQKLDPVTVAKFGRWKSPQLLLDTYGHAEEQEVSIRERFRTNSVQSETSDPVIPMKKKGEF